MEVRRATLGLTADDLAGIALVATVVGHQGQVDGQLLVAFAQGLGPMPGQGGAGSRAG